MSVATYPFHYDGGSVRHEASQSPEASVDLPFLPRAIRDSEIPSLGILRPTNKRIRL
jgi:hypothetical protein